MERTFLFSLSRLDLFEFLMRKGVHEICLMFLKEKSRGGASYEMKSGSSSLSYLMAIYLAVFVASIF